MAKLVKFPLEMADGTKARSLEELREHSDVASIAAYYESGKLQRWLMANYCEDESEKISAIQEDERKANSGAESAALKAVVDALGLHTISEQNIADFVAEEKDESSVQNNASDFEVEDDEGLKAELSKFITAGTEISGWNISCTEADEEGSFQVQLLQKQLGVYTSLKVKKDENFFPRIAHIIAHNEKSIKTNWHKIVTLQNIIEATPISLNKDSIQYGKYHWNIVRKSKSEALLVCAYALKEKFWVANMKSDIEDNALFAATRLFSGSRHPDDCLYAETSMRKWLNDDFVKDAFSADEFACLRKNSLGDSVFLLSEDDVIYFKPEERVKTLMETKERVKWWTANYRIIDENGGFNEYINNNRRGGKYGIVPAIIVSLEA